MFATFVLPALLVGIATPETLPDNLPEAAVACGAALRGTGASATVENAVIGTHLALLAGRATHPDKAPVENMMTYLVQMSDAAPQAASGADELLPLCKARFPTAWNTDNVTLPTDTFERDSLCLIAGAMLVGIATGAKNSGQPAVELERFSALLERFAPIAGDAILAAHGYGNPDGTQRLLGDRLRWGFDRGNLLAVGKSCERLP